MVELDPRIDRPSAARDGLNIADVQSIVSAAIGGDNIGETVAGLRRFPINVRYPRELRDSVEKLRDLSSAVREMQRAVTEEIRLPPGYSISWSGQFEYLERASAKLAIVVPATLVIIFVLLYLTFRRFGEAALIMTTLPFALVGGLWLIYLLGYNMSIAAAVGFIALGGVAAEIGVIMLVYVNHAVASHKTAGRLTSETELIQAIVEGAALRVRPIAMTVAVIIAGLLPIMWGGGTGSEVMQRIAAPMVGGMITAPLLSMLVIPTAYPLLRRRSIGT